MRFPRRPPRRPWRFAALCVLLLPLLLRGQATASEHFTGTVVGISDGDTISVVREGKAVKVRLHGIDTLERKQAFGTRARQFISTLAFQQQVTVVVRNMVPVGL